MARSPSLTAPDKPYSAPFNAARRSRKANAPRARGAPPRNFNFSRYTVHDTEDRSDPVARYPDHTPEFMAEVERLYQEGFHADAEQARIRGWVKLKQSHVIGTLAKRIADGLVFKLAARE